MPARKLKPIEERDPHAAAVLDAYDNLNRQPRTVKFRPVFLGPNGAFALGMEIEAEVIDFGLALHPFVEGTAAEPALATDGSTTISDPVTGCSVTFAITREGALHRLGDLVRRHGGRMGFDRAIAVGRRRIERLLEQVDPPLPSPIPDVRAVICPHEAQP